MNRSRGLSLIEVVAALALLAGAAAGLLTAHGAALGQLAATRHQETATTLAEELITEWKIKPPNGTGEREGRFEGRPSWRWTRSLRPYPSVGKAPIRELTLIIYRMDERGKEQVMGSYTSLETADDQ